MAMITIYGIGYVNAFSGELQYEVADSVKSPIPDGYTRSSPYPIPDGHYAMMANGWVYVLGEIPVPPPPDYSAQNKAQASTLLQQTDWVELGDVADPANPPYLSNKAAFTSYRAALRSIAVNPPTTPAVFPAKPDEVWSQ